MAYLTYKEIEEHQHKKAERFIISLKTALGQMEKADPKHVGVVAVMDGDKILMGKRSDNQKWTNPGGHLEGKEDPKEGALRELKEEAGLEHSDAEKMVSKKVTAPDGVKLVVHAFKVEHDGQKPNSKNDPDKEVKKWEWIDTKNFPDDVKNNLHSPKNIILQNLGIIKSMIFSLIKSAPHKYLRKYKRGANWVYVYHEGTNAPRQIPPEAIEHIRQLAEKGDEGAKALHESIGEYSQPKLQLLRELADMGDADAKRHLKENHAIDRDQEKLEESVGIARPPKDIIEKPLTDEQKTKVKQSLIGPVTETLTYLSRHQGNPFNTSLSSIGGLDGIKARIAKEVHGASTIKEALEKLHTIAKDMERVQPNASTSSNSTIKNGGGYGNVLYNETVKEMETRGLLPEGYSTIHQRVGGHPNHSIPNAAGVAEKAAARKAEEQAREKRELAEINGSMAHFMTSLMPMSSRDRIENARELDRKIQMIFGKRLKKEDWPYNFDGMKTKITSINFTSEGFSLDMQVQDAQGNNMMESWTRRFSRKDGRPHIYNAYMKVREGARGAVQVGSLINQGQRKLMKSIQGGGTIGVSANIDVGGYNWANHGFSFTNDSELFQYKSQFKSFLIGKGIHLSDADMEKFKEPFHIAAFTDGKKYVQPTSGNAEIKLSPEQIQSKSLVGIEGQHPLTPQEIRSGKASRMAVNLGKMFMLGKSWSGKWDSAKDTEANKFADKYYEMRDRAVNQANHGYQDILMKVKAGERGRAQAPTPTQRGSAFVERPSPSNTSHSERLIRNYSGRSTTGNIRLTEARISSINRMDDNNFAHFMSNARLNPAQKARLRTARGARR